MDDPDGARRLCGIQGALDAIELLLGVDVDDDDVALRCGTTADDRARPALDLRDERAVIDVEQPDLRTRFHVELVDERLGEFRELFRPFGAATAPSESVTVAPQERSQ